MKELQPITPTGYAKLLRELKQKIQSAQLRVAGRQPGAGAALLAGHEGLFSEEPEVHTGVCRGLAGKGAAQFRGSTIVCCSI